MDMPGSLIDRSALPDPGREDLTRALHQLRQAADDHHWRILQGRRSVFARMLTGIGRWLRRPRSVDSHPQSRSHPALDPPIGL